MTPAYGAWSGPAGALALAIDSGVGAARSGDADSFSAALADLSELDQEQLAVLLGALTRDLIERSHPDGLDAEDAEEVLRSCRQSAATWFTSFDEDALILALTGALGIYDPAESGTSNASVVIAHGLLLIADQLDATRQRLRTVLDDALREIRRAQTVELP